MSSGRFGRTPVLASTAPATLVYALRNHYPTEMPGSQARVTPTPNERLEGQRCFAAHCDFMSRRRFVVGRCQIWRQSRQSLRSGVTAFCEAIDLLHRSIIFARVAPRPTNGKMSFILKLFADAQVQLRRSQWPLPELLPVH